MNIFKWKMRIPADRHGHTIATGTCQTNIQDNSKVKELILSMRNNLPCYSGTLEIVSVKVKS